MYVAVSRVRTLSGLWVSGFSSQADSQDRWLPAYLPAVDVFLKETDELQQSQQRPIPTASQYLGESCFTCTKLEAGATNKTKCAKKECPRWLCGACFSADGEWSCGVDSGCLLCRHPNVTQRCPECHAMYHFFEELPCRAGSVPLPQQNEVRLLLNSHHCCICATELSECLRVIDVIDTPNSLKVKLKRPKAHSLGQSQNEDTHTPIPTEDESKQAGQSEPPSPTAAASVSTQIGAPRKSRRLNR